MHLPPISHSSSVDPAQPPNRAKSLRGPHAASGASVPASENDRPDGTASQIDGLVSKLQELPETRDDVVAVARERVAQGGHLTRDAAERTAARILGT